MSDGADLATCLDAVQERYLVAEGSQGETPSLSENRDTLRLFAGIGDELREAVLNPLRVLAWPEDETASSAPTVRLRPVASRPS